MWLDNLKELKKEAGMSVKQIADVTNLPERTVSRIFSGDTEHPYMDTLQRVVSVLGGSLDSLFADTKVVVGNSDLITLQSDIDKLSNELATLREENTMLKDIVNKITTENDILRMKLEHKEEIISLHNYYNKLKSGN